MLFQEFWYLPGQSFDWPPYIYIRNKKNGHYLRQRGAGKPFLCTIRPGRGRDGCHFRVLELGSQVALMGSNGRVVTLLINEGQSGGYFCLEDVPGSALNLFFNCLHAGDNSFHFAKQHYDKSYFLSASTSTSGFKLNLDPLKLLRVLKSIGSASEDTLMEVEEAVINRRISDIKYDTVTDKDISKLTPRAVLTTTVRNDSRTHDSKCTLHYHYTKSVAGSWTSTRTEAVSSKVTFTARMPTVRATSEVGYTESEQHTWGETNTKTVQVSNEHVLVIYM